MIVHHKYIKFLNFINKLKIFYNLLGYERLLRFFFNPDIQKKIIFRIKYEDFIYEGYLNEFIDWCIFFKGYYQKEEINLIKEFSSKKGNAFDVGSFCGTHSLIMSKYFKNIYSFEPNKISFKRQKKNININKIKNIYLYNLSISKKNGQSKYYYPRDRKLSETSLVKSSLYSKYKFGFSKTVTIDSFINKNKIKSVNFIKIDAEFYEKNILIGAKKTIEKLHPTFMFEYNFKSKDGLKYQYLKKIFLKKYKIYLLKRKINLFFYSYDLVKVTSQKQLSNYDGLLLVTRKNNIKLFNY